MRAFVGAAGPKVRADVQIEWSASSGFGYEVESSVAAIYGEAIKSQIELAAYRYGRPNLHLKCVDSGGLPFVWEARLDAAFQTALGQSVSLPTKERPAPTRERRRRSRLYIPASSPKLILNAPSAKADALVFDLEDAVALDEKREALYLLAHALTTLEFGDSEIMVRVNSVEEVKALAHCGVDVFVLPKVEGRELLEEAAIASPNSLLFPLIENAAGVEAALDIARGPNVVAVSLGLEDYLAEIGAQRTESQAESEWVQGRVLNAATAARIDPLASVVASLDDQAVTAYAARAKTRGWRGVGCIHPSQVPLVHRAFQPSEEEISWARGILLAAEGLESGAVRAEGQMVDRPVIQRAMRILAMEDAP